MGEAVEVKLQAVMTPQYQNWIPGSAGEQDFLFTILLLSNCNNGCNNKPSRSQHSSGEKNSKERKMENSLLWDSISGYSQCKNKNKQNQNQPKLKTIPERSTKLYATIYLALYFQFHFISKFTFDWW